MTNLNDSTLLDAMRQYADAQKRLGAALQDVGLSLQAIEDRIIELTETAIDVHKAERH